MFDVNVAAVLVVVLLALVALGVHIAIALGVASAIGIFLVTGDFNTVTSMLGSTAYEALRDYVFAVIPLFMLMGEFVGRSGAVTDIYKGINRGLRRLPGRLAIATVLGNALFSFVTGVSIASAAAFSRISYPEMKRHGYARGFALGTVAGSSCLGMLIPPSVLMIVWGILTEKSIGQIFLAGVVPGIMITLLYCFYVFIVALINPATVGGTLEAVDDASTERDAKETGWRAWTSGGGMALVVAAVFGGIWFGIFTPTSGGGMALVVAAVFGGIWFGIFTPTEAAGAGAFIALIMALLKGIGWRGVIESILAVGRTSAPILLLLVTASLYSRALAMTGVTSAIQDFFIGTGLSAGLILLAMVAIWFVLGMVIDSISIMLLTVTIFEPIAVHIGFDPIAFAIIGILAIEAGLLTPPFGLIVFTVKAAVEDDSVTVWEIFRSSTPYWVIMLIGVILLYIFPQIATWLPGLMF